MKHPMAAQRAWPLLLLPPLLAGCDGGPRPTSTDGAPEASATQQEDEEAFTLRCQRETLAEFPATTAQIESICTSRWEMVLATAPIADAILSLAPAQGESFNLQDAERKLPSVTWLETPAEGQVRSGNLDDFFVGLVSDPVPGVSFNWFRNGEPIPFDLEETLKVRGATLSMIGCLSYGVSEGSRVYEVNAPGKAPFALGIGFRSAAVASQSSDYGVRVDFSGSIPTLASLLEDGTEWTQTCTVPDVG